jgi:hypothetical protein
MDKHERQLYRIIKTVIQDSRHKSPLQIHGQILLTLDSVEELVLLGKNDALLEAAEIVKSEYENPSELPYTHMVKQIRDKMTDNQAKILELIKSQYNGLFKDVKEIEDED